MMFVAEGIDDTVEVGKLPSPMLISATIVVVALVVRLVEEFEDVDDKLVIVLDGEVAELFDGTKGVVEALELF